MRERARPGLAAIAVIAMAGCYPEFDFSTPRARRPATTSGATTTGAAGGAGGAAATGGAGGATATTTDTGSTTTTTGSTTTTTTTTGSTTGTGTTSTGAGGAGGAGGATTTSAGGAGGATTTTTTTTTTTSSTTACAIDHPVISEVRTRGSGGASDEFIEIYNPSDVPLTLDGTWKIEARSWKAQTYGQRWNGDGVVLAPRHHLLVASAGYSAGFPDYDMGAFGIADAGSIRIVRSGQVIDALCYYFDGASLAAIKAPGYSCEGTPVSNLPHDNSDGGESDSDVSLERRPGGALGGCHDTGNSLADFQTIAPAHPETMADPATP